MQYCSPLLNLQEDVVLHTVYSDLGGVGSVVMHDTAANITVNGTWALAYSKGHKFAMDFGASNLDTGSVRISDVAG
jgi:hypothetical protein